MQDETIKTLVATVTVGAVVIVGMLMGFDGVVLGTGLGILSGLGGYFAGKKA